MATDEVLLFEDADFEMDVDSLPPSQLEDEHTGAQLQVPHLTVAGSDTDGEATDKETDEDAASDTSRSSIIDQLEKIVLDFLEQLLHAMPGADGTNSTQGRKRKIVIELVDRRKPTKDDGSLTMRQLVFPQRAKHASSKPTAQFLRVVDLIHEALITGTPTTKRDMFYKDVHLFGSQAVVDRLVDDIAATIGARRADLNVRASSKGLISGKGLKMHTYTGETIEIITSESTLILPSEEVQRYEVQDDLSWVLVVEKEAVFQTLMHLRLAENADLPGPGLIITGKGYPDVATRQLVCILSENLPMTVPILALVDCDPYGIDILSVYKYGSLSMSHEQDSLVAPRIAWMGMRSEDITELGIERGALIPITKHDQKKAMAMLRRSDLPRKWRRELQHMVHNRRKAEIEILSSTDTVSFPPHSANSRFACDGMNMRRAHVPGQRSGLLDYVVERIGRAVQKSAEKFGS